MKGMSYCRLCGALRKDVLAQCREESAPIQQGSVFWEAA